MNRIKILKRCLALCLCMVMCAGTAFAEKTVELGWGGMDDSLFYECSLPDGRQLLIGEKAEADGNGADQKTWLVCLNTDHSISWEYIEQEKGDCWIPCAAVLADGTIAVAYRRFRGSDDKIVAKFFTPEGEPIGKEIEISTKGESLWVHKASANFLTLERQIAVDGQENLRSEMEIWNWDGSLVSRYSPEEMLNGFFYIDEEEDGVLLYGEDSAKRAKIMKKDSLQGTVLWANTLEHNLPVAEDAMLYNVVRTGDGGYVALVQEYVDAPYRMKISLVKLDREGRIQWLTGKDTDQLETFCSMIVYDGKIVLYTNLNGEEQQTVQTFRWLDMDGKELDTTELVLKAEEFPSLQPGAGKLIIGSLQLVPLNDGLWAIVNGRMSTDPAKNEAGETLHDYIMVRIPEL